MVVKGRFVNAVTNWLTNFPYSIMSTNLQSIDLSKVSVIYKILQFFLNEEDFNNIDVEAFDSSKQAKVKSILKDSDDVCDTNYIKVPYELNPQIETIENLINNHINNYLKKIKHQSEQIRLKNNNTNHSLNKLIKINNLFKSINLEKLFIYSKFDEITKMSELLLKIGNYSSNNSNLSITNYNSLTDDDKRAIHNYLSDFDNIDDFTSGISEEEHGDEQENLLLKNETLEYEYELKLKQCKIDKDVELYQELCNFDQEKYILESQIDELKLKLSQVDYNDLENSSGQNKDHNKHDANFVNSLLWEIKIHELLMRSNLQL